MTRLQIAVLVFAVTIFGGLLAGISYYMCKADDLAKENTALELKVAFLKARTLILEVEKNAYISSANRWREFSVQAKDDAERYRKILGSLKGDGDTSRWLDSRMPASVFSSGMFTIHDYSGQLDRESGH